MDTPFLDAIRRPKKKLFTQLDFRNSPLFSQNPLIFNIMARSQILLIPILGYIHQLNTLFKL
jgi:hypothetical protein